MNQPGRLPRSIDQRPFLDQRALHLDRQVDAEPARGQLDLALDFG